MKDEKPTNNKYRKMLGKLGNILFIIGIIIIFPFILSGMYINLFYGPEGIEYYDPNDITSIVCGIGFLGISLLAIGGKLMDWFS